MTTTIKDVKEIFDRKGMHFANLPPQDLVVTKVDVVERHVSTDGEASAVLNIRYLEEGRREKEGLFVCRGRTQSRKVPPPPMEIPLSSKLKPLPTRETYGFDSDADAESYLRVAMSHLLKDKGYEERDPVDGYLHFVKPAMGFYFSVSARFDEAGLSKANELVGLRGKYGPENGYGLVAPAFQDSLGVPLIQQEHWISRNGEFFAGHRIGIYTVNNKNPNQIFPCTIYPQKDREMVRYFITTTQQWPFMREKYIQHRAKRGKGETLIYRSPD